MLFVAMFMAMPFTYWTAYNSGVRTGYDAVAKAIGVTDTKAFVIGDAKITSKGIYHKRKPQIVGDFLACSSSCHGKRTGNG